VLDFRVLVAGGDASVAYSHARNATRTTDSVTLASRVPLQS